ncbi:hypothetical protein O5D80_002363 [Batrachochytrium dendrobatidis]|nr:hypothetical protein O5D80_002363 [Batrachochytrium dendrobatidis]
MTVLVSSSSHHIANLHALQSNDASTELSVSPHILISAHPPRTTPPQPMPQRSISIPPTYTMPSVVSHDILLQTEHDTSQASFVSKKLDGVYAKQTSRIQSLERNIEYMQKEHSKMLVQLHEEIERLQAMVTDSNMKLVSVAETEGVERHAQKKSGLGGLSIGLDLLSGNSKRTSTFFKSHGDTSHKTGVDLIGRMRDWVQSDSGKPHISKTNVSDDKVDVSLSETGYTGSSDSPIYILVERERKKYQGILERMTEENKRKQSEINHLRGDMDVVCEVLALAGLKFDIKEFQNIIQSHQNLQPGLMNTKNSQQPVVLQVDIASKAFVLPPISKKEKVSDKLVSTVTPGAAKCISNTSKEVSNSKTAASPPVIQGSSSTSSKIRAIRYRLGKKSRSIAIGDTGVNHKLTALPSDSDPIYKETEQTPHNHQSQTIAAMEIDEEQYESELADSISAIHVFDNLARIHDGNVFDSTKEYVAVDESTKQVFSVDNQSEADTVVESIPTTLMSVYHPPRCVRVSSNPASILSGSSTLRNTDPTVCESALNTASITHFQPVSISQTGGSLPQVRSLKQPHSRVEDKDELMDRKFTSYNDTEPMMLQSQKSPKSTHTGGYVGRLIKSRLVREKQKKNAQNRSL